MKVIDILDFCIPAEDASYDELSDFADRIAELATYPIEAEPVRRGTWEEVTNGRGGHECSVCHSYAPAWQTGEERLTDYCPNCGALMEDLMTEFNKLENYLRKANCPYERIDTNDYGLERHMIFVPNEKDREWDCICFPGSFGYKDGLLEIMGNIVEGEDDVEGFLTADQVIQKIEKTYGWSYSHDE